MMRGFALTIAALLVFYNPVFCQNGISAISLADVLTPNYFILNEAARVLSPPEVFLAATPIAIRYVLLLTLVEHEVIAACDPVVLSFFGTKDHIPGSFCISSLSRARIHSQMLYRLLLSEFPVVALPYGQFLSKYGLNPFNRSKDKSTEVGWANAMAARLANYFAKDGWNSRGDLTKDNHRAQFQDSSSYLPINPAHLPPEKLKRPLRWQPLTRPSGSIGGFESQVHVTPHIGIKGKPLALTRQEVDDRKVPSLYNTPDRNRSMSKVDRELATKLITDLFARSAKVTTKKIALAYFWESKFISLGFFALSYQRILGIEPRVQSQILLGETIAMHDAVLTAWKEKRRHDLVRPTTLIRKLFYGKMVLAFRGYRKGVGVLKAEEWEPVVPIQPHSEYPSASAAICTSSFEHLDIALNHLVLNGNGTLPPYSRDIFPASLPGNPIESLVQVQFKSLDDASRSCGQSRLNSGVHFGPSVPAGHSLGEGIGRAAFEHVADLYRGRIPKNCPRCRRK